MMNCRRSGVSASVYTCRTALTVPRSEVSDAIINNFGACEQGLYGADRGRNPAWGGSAGAAGEGGAANSGKSGAARCPWSVGACSVATERP